jgi:DNA-binding CsgD family transcriptional regulator
VSRDVHPRHRFACMSPAAFAVYDTEALEGTRPPARGSLEGAARALDWLPLAVLTVSPDALILYRNRRASRYLAHARGIRESHGKLRCARSQDSGKLASSLKKLARDGAGSETIVLTIGRTDGGQPLALLLTPTGERRNTCVFAFDPGEPAGFSPFLARSLYGLSEREAEVASAVVAGNTLEQIAATLGVERETVRSHLKRVFVKTQTSRQSELVRLFSTGLFGLLEAR